MRVFIFVKELRFTRVNTLFLKKVLKPVLRNRAQSKEIHYNDYGTNLCCRFLILKWR